MCSRNQKIFFLFATTGFKAATPSYKCYWKASNSSKFLQLWGLTESLNAHAILSSNGEGRGWKGTLGYWPFWVAKIHSMVDSSPNMAIVKTCRHLNVLINNAMVAAAPNFRGGGGLKISDQNNWVAMGKKLNLRGESLNLRGTYNISHLENLLRQIFFYWI